LADEAKTKTKAPPTKSTSAERAARSSETKRQQNRSLKSAGKSKIIKADEQIASGDREKATTALNDAIRSIDKSVKKKILHLNTASRRKSGLVKKFNKAFGKENPLGKSKPAAKGKAAKKEA
jgi:small subunit ribosomal protein S20